MVLFSASVQTMWKRFRQRQRHLPMLPAEQSGSTARNELQAAPRKHKFPEPNGLFCNLGALLNLSISA